jgi:hypothetical protein
MERGVGDDLEEKAEVPEALSERCGGGR